jgi:hypothetical protein
MAAADHISRDEFRLVHDLAAGLTRGLHNRHHRHRGDRCDRDQLLEIQHCHSPSVVAGRPRYPKSVIDRAAPSTDGANCTAIRSAIRASAAAAMKVVQDIRMIVIQS